VRSLPLACAALLLSACATTHPLDVSDAAARQAITERAGRHVTKVTVRGEPPADARALQVSADSTRWIDPATGSVRAVPTSQVERVSFLRRDASRGGHLARGLLIGATVGAAVGAAVGYATGPPFPFPRQVYVGVMAGGTALYGAGIGGVVAVAPFTPERFVLVPADSVSAGSPGR
jgi:hypothetical protein